MPQKTILDGNTFSTGAFVALLDAPTALAFAVISARRAALRKAKGEA